MSRLYHWAARRLWDWLTDYDLSDPDLQRALGKARREMEHEERAR